MELINIFIIFLTLYLLLYYKSLIYFQFQCENFISVYFINISISKFLVLMSILNFLDSTHRNSLETKTNKVTGLTLLSYIFSNFHVK